VVVTGLIGKQSIEKSRPDIHFEYFNLPGINAALREHRQLVTYLRKFDDVSIFYGKFVNVVDQVATTTRLASGDRLATLPVKEQKAEAERHRYLFEPELPEVVEFFDTQIFAMLFGQTINESSLAQLGSRITAMEIASSNIEKRYEQLLVDQRRARRELRNKKQRQMLAGISLWG